VQPTGFPPNETAAMVQANAHPEARWPVSLCVCRWGRWDEQLHGRIAGNIRAQQRYRYRLFDYAVMEGR
jgi:hypothetical protein